VEGLTTVGDSEQSSRDMEGVAIERNGKLFQGLAVDEAAVPFRFAFHRRIGIFLNQLVPEVRGGPDPEAFRVDLGSDEVSGSRDFALLDWAFAPSRDSNDCFIIAEGRCGNGQADAGVGSGAGA